MRLNNMGSIYIDAVTVAARLEMLRRKTFTVDAVILMEEKDGSWIFQNFDHDTAAPTTALYEKDMLNELTARTKQT